MSSNAPTAEEAVKAAQTQLVGDETNSAPTDDFLFNLTDKIYRARKQLITAGVVVVLILGGVFAVKSYLDRQEHQRNVALYKLEQQLGQGFAASDLTEKLEAYSTKFKGTHQATLADLYRAGLYGNRGEIKEAQELLTNLIERFKASKGLSVFAQVTLANLLKDAGRKEEALEVLNRPGSGLEDVLIFERAQTLRALGKKDLAKVQLDLLIKEYPQSPYAQVASKLIPTL